MKKCKVLFLLLVAFSTASFGQEKEEKVIIINKSGDDEVTQEIKVETTEGENGEIVIKMNGEEIKIDPKEYSEDDKRNYSVTIIKDGEKMEWNGEGNIPAEVEQEIEAIKFQEGDVKVREHKVYKFQEGDHEERPVMGVQIENAGGNGALVTEVFDGSGAEKAGLKKGDLIYKVGRKKVGDIEELVSVLSAHEAGDKVKVHFLRGGDKKRKKVELGAMKKHVKKYECKAVPHQTSNYNYKTMEKRVITENPPIERPAVNLYELNINYNQDNENLVVEMTGDAKPTTIRLMNAEGNVIQEVDVNSPDGRIMQVFTLNGEEREGAILEIVQEGKTIREKL